MDSTNLIHTARIGAPAAAECNHREKEHGDEDDEKMEKLFALMRNYRNIQKQQNNNKRKKMAGGGWAPVFQVEDFTSDIEFKRHAPPNNCDNCSKEESVVGNKSCLDLKLTL